MLEISFFIHVKSRPLIHVLEGGIVKKLMSIWDILRNGGGPFFYFIWSRDHWLMFFEEGTKETDGQWALWEMMAVHYYYSV